MNSTKPLFQIFNHVIVVPNESFECNHFRRIDIRYVCIFHVNNVTQFIQNYEKSLRSVNNVIRHLSWIRMKQYVCRLTIFENCCWHYTRRRKQLSLVATSSNSFSTKLESTQRDRFDQENSIRTIITLPLSHKVVKLTSCRYILCNDK